MKFHRIEYRCWLDDPGIDLSAGKLGKALKEAISR